jgi:hypothetical protein
MIESTEKSQKIARKDAFTLHLLFFAPLAALRATFLQ